MKTQPNFKWSLALLVTVLPLVGGCLQDTASASDPKGAATNETISALAATNEPAATEAENLKADGEPAVAIEEAPVKAVATEKPLPASVRTNGPVAEIVKLAESGVDESVLLVYVTNSTSMFSLTADEIIYLNDIGVPSTVVTAILQHDQALKSAPPFWSEPAVMPETNTVQAEAPPPEDIAPQQTAPPPYQEVAPAPAEQPTYSTFYQSLAPYGTWVDVDGYGLCWQPTVVVTRPSWRPYYDNGRWLYSDYGWYWASDYSWGWAPFHYGRWFRHHNMGWCWYPGYTWGASWVSWRYTDGYCGWAPLPPCAVYRPGIGLTYWGRHAGVTFGFGLGFDCYSFVSWNHFHSRHYYRHPVHHDHARRIYHDSVVSTRIVGNRGHVFNQGLPVDHVKRATRTDLQKVAVRETSNISGRGIRADRLSADGKSLTVYRPKFPEANATRVARTETATRDRSGVVRNFSPETAPQGALKPVPFSASRTVERPAAGEARRPVPATALANPSERPNRLSRVEPMIARNNSVNETRVAPTEQRITPNPFASTSPSATTTRQSRPSVALTPRPSTQVQPTRPGTPAPATTARPAPNVAQNWQTAPSASAPGTRTDTASRSPWANRQSTAPAAQAVPPARPQRSYSTPAQSQSVPRVAEAPRTTTPAAPRFAPTQTPNQPRYTATPTPSYQAPARPSYSPPAHSAPAPQQREFRMPTPSYQAPATRPAPAPSYQAPAPASRPSYQAPAQTYQAPAPSYQAPAARSAPAPAPSPSYSAPSRPSSSSSESRGSSGDSRGGRPPR